MDKGISLIMIENYLRGTIWRYAMKNEYIKKGLAILEMTKNYCNEQNKLKNFGSL